MKIKGGEFGLINLIASELGTPKRGVRLGIGDDAAVLESPRGSLVATVDMLVEGVHFDLSFTEPEELGHKAAAVNISDIAAMTATPLYLLVSLGVREDLDSTYIKRIYQGMKALAASYNTQIVGGDTVKSPGALLIDVVAIGEAPQEFTTRSGAEVGDLVAVTGSVGSSACGLHLLLKNGRQENEAVRAHLLPVPRVKEAEELRKVGITAMIDISDGVASEVNHIAAKSGVGAVIRRESLPIRESTFTIARDLGQNPYDLALYGGEDYELLLTIKPDRYETAKKALAKLGTPLTAIGIIVEKEYGVTLENSNKERVPLGYGGWNHFAE